MPFERFHQRIERRRQRRNERRSNDVPEQSEKNVPWPKKSLPKLLADWRKFREEQAAKLREAGDIAHNASLIREFLESQPAQLRGALQRYLELEDAAQRTFKRYPESKEQWERMRQWIATQEDPSVVENGLHSWEEYFQQKTLQSLNEMIEGDWMPTIPIDGSKAERSEE